MSKSPFLVTRMGAPAASWVSPTRYCMVESKVTAVDHNCVPSDA